MGIQLPPIGPQQCSVHIHQTTETSSSPIEEVRCILYLDMLIMAQSKQALLKHLATAIDLLISLGFIINLQKSMVEPTHLIEFLGFLFNSISGQESPPDSTVSQEASPILTDHGQITSIAVIGLMVAAHPAIFPASLYYRQLEKQKITQVQLQGYDSSMNLTIWMKNELLWWINHLKKHNGCSLQITQWDTVGHSGTQ